MLTIQDLQEQREQIQRDLDCLLDGYDNDTVYNASQIIVDRFKILIKLKQEESEFTEEEKEVLVAEKWNLVISTDGYCRADKPTMVADRSIHKEHGLFYYGCYDNVEEKLLYEDLEFQKLEEVLGFDERLIENEKVTGFFDGN
jgi:hypothetical protein